jgi:hypothetical protein
MVVLHKLHSSTSKAQSSTHTDAWEQLIGACVAGSCGSRLQPLGLNTRCGGAHHVRFLLCPLALGLPVQFGPKSVLL